VIASVNTSFRRLSKAFRLVPYLGHIVRNTSTLLIISHMRSRSTLLAHILGSAPEVIGYIEHHRSIGTSWDLNRLKLNNLLLNGDLHTSPKWSLDKLLHSRYTASGKVIQRPDVKWVILLRNPLDTIVSIVKLARKTGLSQYDSPSKAFSYYSERFAFIRTLANTIPEGVIFINSDSILARSSEVLQELQSFLSLDQPLKEDFKLFPKTGQPYYGDSSHLITLGKIQPNVLSSVSIGNLPIEYRLIEADLLKLEEEWLIYVSSVEFI